MATFKEIQSQIEALQKQAEEARLNEISQAVAQIRQLMEDYGITIDDLSSHHKKGVKKATGTAKYRDPETGQEWTGRGRMPNWLAGKNKDQFLI
jgi:DNA-binding protein H-NS